MPTAGQITIGSYGMGPLGGVDNAERTRDDQIAWAPLYLEPVEESGGDIAAAVQELYQPSLDKGAGK
jgi:hypothetical protein